ncbi:ATP-binding cassette domain-containing protein [Streptomyces sp. A3M-1-3]|uniref:ABC transporter ATP-binding protein n=1 Tax=Streptomyces sp. A3M-1-3 TaxID=2962044 RepID=UPI0020B7AC69|nr:ATP-binding cassette domain-containing protein [Streptomyces sp. A3M-1-3]MCP3818568.1 ATP-binding cassette domain-containing protein [Streptomyces sp. A3M-1-3]
MLQAIGLTSAPRRDLPPAVDDLTFEARPGRVTALLGAPDSGKTTVLRLMLELEPGRGVTYFRGRPLHRIAHPAREVGVLLGDVPGHPARTVRSQLRMLCAASGVPASRADDMLEVVGISGLRDQRLGTLSLGMDRRLGLAAALLGDPCTLVLDEPADGLSLREQSWLHGLLRGHAAHGGTVLFTTADPKEAARTADRVVTIDEGRLVADQEAVDFARTRLRPRVAVRTPHAARLADLVAREARAAQRSVEVVAEDGNRLSVYGSSCAIIGETAFRHGILVHQLADEVGDSGPTAASAVPGPSGPSGRSGAEESLAPPALPHPVRNPLRPFRYELRRVAGVRTAPLVAAVVLASSVVIAVLLARTGHTPLPQVFAAWPEFFPLPPAALGAGLLGALAFGEEFRYPALAADRGTVPRRLGLLLAKLTVSAGVALLLAGLSAAAAMTAVRLVYGGDVTQLPADWVPLASSWAGLTIGCAWAGLLAAGVFRATAAGLAAVLAVPVLVVPLVHKAIAHPSARSAVGFPARLRELAWVEWPHAADRWLVAAMRVMSQPVGAALTLSLVALLCAYLFTGLRSRARW